jgi:hypothetical protein
MMCDAFYSPDCNRIHGRIYERARRRLSHVVFKKHTGRRPLFIRGFLKIVIRVRAKRIADKLFRMLYGDPYILE